MKNKVVAGLLAIFLGGLGVHKFYLGKTGQGLLYLVFFWTFIPAIIALVEGIIYLTQPEEVFDAQWNGGRASTALGVQATTESLARLDALRQSGGLTDAEYEAKKAELLKRI